jgi:hypothetical protein
MALSAGFAARRHGQSPSVVGFAYNVRNGTKIWRGGMLGVDASRNLVPINTVAALAVAFVGMADRDYDNSANASASTDKVLALKGTFVLTVPGATPASINAAVYATDDNTFTLAASTNLQIGTITGFDGAQTVVKLLGT